MKVKIPVLLIFIGSCFLTLTNTAFAQPIPGNPFKYAEVPSCEPEANNPTIMRFFTHALCGKCPPIKQKFEEVMDEYAGQVTYYIWDKNEPETIPQSEWDICNEMTDGLCGNPTTILGCKYHLLAESGTSDYKGAVREVIDHLLSATPGPSSPRPSITPSYLPGDVNHDGTVNSVDVQIIITNFLTRGDSSYWPDANLDQHVNSLDFSWVVKDWRL